MYTQIAAAQTAVGSGLSCVYQFLSKAGENPLPAFGAVAYLGSCSSMISPLHSPSLDWTTVSMSEATVKQGYVVVKKAFK